MKLIIFDTYYKAFLNYFYNRNPNLNSKSFDQHKNLLLSAFFGTSDFYSYNLKLLCHEAEDFIVNDKKLQDKWAKENEIKLKMENIFSRIRGLPYLYKFLGKPFWIVEILIAQIKKIKPDVVLIHDLSLLNKWQLQEIKENCKLLVGQIASALPPRENLIEYNLLLSSFPHFVDLFRKRGIKSEYFRIGFEKRVYEKIKKQPKLFDVSFIGSFSPYHRTATKIIEDLSSKMKINIWGRGLNFLSPFSPIRKYYHGEVWGADMYKTIAQSKIVLNRHSDLSSVYANNMRLFETTGMGSMLITDKKENMKDFFEEGKEVITYSKAEDLQEKINYYLNNNKEREKIAIAGMKRTHAEHTYFERMKELSIILKKYL